MDKYLTSNTRYSGNVSVGDQVLFSNTIVCNVKVGYQTLRNNVTGERNVGIGGITIS